jgi:very-short-patch-repair endonuclease
LGDIVPEAKRVVDGRGVYFVSIKKKLVIELDGSQHLEQAEYDAERSKYFESQGHRVVPQGDDIRFWNDQVENDVAGAVRAIGLVLSDV